MKQIQFILLIIVLSFFQVNAQKKEKKACSQKVIGRVYLNATQKVIPNALVKLKDHNNKVLNTFETGSKAKYFFELDCNATYKVEASSSKYVTSERILITTTKDKEFIKKNLFLNKKLKKGEKREYLFKGTIDFGYDEWKLTPTITYELDKAILVMKDNPNLIIHFESHTDSRAPADFNMDLSEKRVDALKEYLGFKEVFRKRITGEAYGETKPVNKCVKGVQCTDEEYLENRRTSFILKEKTS